MTDRPPPGPAPTDYIEIGDQLARCGDWCGAIDHWQHAAGADDRRRKAVERRLSWLIEQLEPSRPALRTREVRLVIGASVAALLGTLLVLIAGEPGTASANLMAAAAWALYIASATLVLIAAHRRPNADLDDLVGRARVATNHLAARRHEDNAHMTTDFREMPESPAREHRDAAPETARVAVLTMSDTRTREEDRSGEIIRQGLNWRGFSIASYEIVPDDPDRIRAQLAAWLAAPGIDAIITNGGTGISSRDSTYEVVDSLLEKRLDGFGELFRMLSWQEIGAAAMLSRAVAGSVGPKAIFCLPGSSNAVTLAMEKLIGPELGHVIHELRKHRIETGP